MNKRHTETLNILFSYCIISQTRRWLRDRLLNAYHRGCISNAHVRRRVNVTRIITAFAGYILRNCFFRLPTPVRDRQLVDLHLNAMFTRVMCGRLIRSGLLEREEHYY